MTQAASTTQDRGFPFGTLSDAQYERVADICATNSRDWPEGLESFINQSVFGRSAWGSQMTLKMVISDWVRAQPEPDVEQ